MIVIKNNCANPVIIEHKECSNTLQPNQRITYDVAQEEEFKISHSYPSHLKKVKKVLLKYEYINVVLDSSITIKNTGDDATIYINEQRGKIVQQDIDFFCNSFVFQIFNGYITKKQYFINDIYNLRKRLIRQNIKNIIWDIISDIIVFLLFEPYFIYSFIYTSHKLIFALLMTFPIFFSVFLHLFSYKRKYKRGKTPDKIITNNFFNSNCYINNDVMWENLDFWNKDYY